MPLVCPWRQGTTDRDVTTRLKFSQPERILVPNSGSNVTVNINNPTVRDDQDIREIIRQVTEVFSRRDELALLGSYR